MVKAACLSITSTFLSNILLQNYLDLKCCKDNPNKPLAIVHVWYLFTKFLSFKHLRHKHCSHWLYIIFSHEIDYPSNDIWHASMLLMVMGKPSIPELQYTTWGITYICSFLSCSLLFAGITENTWLNMGIAGPGSMAVEDKYNSEK